jgi:hypothetical protein
MTLDLFDEKSSTTDYDRSGLFDTKILKILETTGIDLLKKLADLLRRFPLTTTRPCMLHCQKKKLKKKLILTF